MSPTQWSESNKKTFCVMAASVAALPVSLGTVYCADKFLPRQMDWLKDVVATHIVEPHIELFDTLTKNIKKAHDRYDEKRDAYLVEHGAQVPRKEQEDVHQRAKEIAGEMLTFSTALTADIAASYLIQKKLNKEFGVCTQPFRTCFAEGAVQLLLTAAMPTVFAGISEDMHHGISRMVRKTTGAGKKVADDIGISSTYVAFPGLLAAAAALVSAHHGVRSRS
jgi:hypothetical protein